MDNKTLVSTEGVTISEGINVLPALKLIPVLAPFKVGADNVDGQAGRAVIDTEEAYGKASNLATICQQNWDQLEDLRKAVKGPVDDYAKFIQALFVPLQLKFKAAKDTTLAKMLTFQKAETARRAAAAEAVRKANEEAAQKLAEEAQERGDTATASAILDVATMAPVPVAAPRFTGSNAFGKSTSARKVWVASVAEPMVVLKAIIDGKLPISLIKEWSTSELNRIAGAVKAETTSNGLKIEFKESLQQR